jgi:hypothetical protein
MDITSVAAASRNFRYVHPAEKHFQIHEIKHLKTWLYELSVLAVINHTAAHSIFRSPLYVSIKMCVNTILWIVLCECMFTAAGREISRKLNIM